LYQRVRANAGQATHYKHLSTYLGYASSMEESNDNTPLFSSFELPESLQLGLKDAGFSNCTEIQALSLPIALRGKDVTGQAQTGTGKTAAFLIATNAHLLRSPVPEGRKANQPRALIVAPTRELAIQIHKDAVQLGAHTGLSLGLAYGGVDYEKQRDALAAGVDILIGTPGRIIDYLKQGVFDLKAGQVVVLDEADRMFDLGFINDIRYLLRRLPPPAERLSMLFSATLSQRVLELAYEHMNEPESVKTVSDEMTAERIAQSLYHPAKEEKTSLLVGLLREMKPSRSMVFVNTKVVADRLLGMLLGNGFKADVLSGDVRQNKRQRLLGEFESGKIDILIGTDVAARGLHIPGVTHVFNFDLPQQEEDYVHRIGRTARAGAEGSAISFACEEYAFSLPTIQEYIGKSIETKPITNDILPELEKPVRIKREPAPNREGKGRNSNNKNGRNKPRNNKPRQGNSAKSGEEQQAKNPANNTSSETSGEQKTEGGNKRRRPRRRGGRNRNNPNSNANTEKQQDSAGQTTNANGEKTSAAPASSDNKPKNTSGNRSRNVRRRNRDRKPAAESNQQNTQTTSTAKQVNKPASTPTDKPAKSGLFGRMKSAAKKILGN